MTLREDAETIMQKAIRASLPDAAVAKALEHKEFGTGKIVVVAIGKAAWQMAKTAVGILDGRISAGIVITKYGHSKGELAPLEIWEAGHPVPDENSLKATQRAIELVRDLTERDTVLFLISGGGSALFEKPLISLKELQDITSDLLASGADIVSMNTVRKRLSSVKGGKFARLCAPAHVYAIVLSDIIGDPLDMIASGPAYPDSSTCEEAMEVIRKFKIMLPEDAEKALREETPKTLDNVETVITGSVTELAAAGQQAAEELGYEPWLLTTSLNCQAKEAGSFLAAIGRQYAASGKRWRYWPGARRWSTSMAGAREAGTRKSPFRLPTALQDWTMWRCSPLAATAPTAPRMQPGVTETDIRRKNSWSRGWPFPMCWIKTTPTTPWKRQEVS